jgi:hypothetical protein
MTDNMPNFHDGFFDGVTLEEGVARLFLRTSNGEKFTLTCYGIEQMNIWDVRAGNIILDIEILGPAGLTVSCIDELYEISSVDADTQRSRLLNSARERGLQALIMNASYGAECRLLFQRWEILSRDRTVQPNASL